MFLRLHRPPGYAMLPDIHRPIPAVFDTLIQHIDGVTQKMKDGIPGAPEDNFIFQFPSREAGCIRFTCTTIDQLKRLAVAVVHASKAFNEAGGRVTR
jgi:hypothetical protein